VKKSFVLIASVFLALFLGIILSVSYLRSNIQLKAVDTRIASLYAFYAAEAGIENSISELRKNEKWRTGFSNIALVWSDGTTTETVGHYTSNVADGPVSGSWPTVWIRSQGMYTNPRDPSQNISRVILAQVAIENPASFFISTLSDITARSGANFTGDILARDVYFKPTTGNIKVTGDVNYIRNIDGESDPKVTITGDVNNVPPITFSSVDKQYYSDVASTGGRKIDGNFSYSGDIDRSDLSSSNGVIYVDGDVHISGNTTESMHIVASGNIYIEGDITCNSGVQLGLSAAGDVIIPDSAPNNLTINAFIRADGGVLEAKGNPGDKDTLNFTGAIAVRGKDSASSAVNLNAYSSRVYNYDDTLSTNLTIPYLTYIANIIDWKEIKPTDPFPPS